MSNSDPTAALVLGFGGGLFSFFRGFKIYRECRVVEDTPQIPIRSIPMGLVSVHGKADGQPPIVGPVSHSPCYFYKVVIEKWKQEQRSSGWAHYRTDLDGSRFYLADESGKVLVDAHGAEMDLTRTCVHEVNSARDSSFQPGAATDEELLRYVTQASVHSFTSFLGSRVAAVGPLQDPQKERTRLGLMAALQSPIRPSGTSPALQGLVGDMIEKRLAASSPAQDPNKEQARLAMVEAFKHPIGSPEFMQQVQKAKENAPQDPNVEQKFAAWTEKMKQGQANIFFSPASGRFRFTEYCIVPGQDYNITGSCIENPDATDAYDRNLITKGVNELTYLISDKPLGKIESGLRNKALLMILGGAALSVVCLGFLLAKLGLF